MKINISTIIVLLVILIPLILLISFVIKKYLSNYKKSILAFIGVLLSMFVGAALWSYLASLVYQKIFNQNFDTDNLKNWIDVLFMESQWIGAFTFLILWNKFVLKYKLSELGLHFKNGFKMYLIGFLISFVWISLVFGLNYVFKTITIKNNITPNIIGAVITYFFTYMLQGFCEEFQFRGMIFKSLSEKYKMSTTIIISGLIFSIVHGLNPGITIPALLNIAFVGFGFGYIYYKTKSLWLVSAIHSTWNFFQGPVYGSLVSGGKNNLSLFISTPIKGKEFLNGGNFGFEGGIITTVISLTLLFIFILFIKNKNVNINK